MNAEDIRTISTQIYKVALRYTKDHYAAEDVVQETLLKAMLSLHTVKDISKANQWMFVVAKRVAIDFIRKNNRKLNNMYETFSQDTEQIVLDRILETEIHERLQELKPEIRLVLVLKLQHDLTEKMISDLLNIPIGTVKSRLFHGKKKLTALIQKNEVLE